MRPWFSFVWLKQPIKTSWPVSIEEEDALFECVHQFSICREMEPCVCLFTCRNNLCQEFGIKLEYEKRRNQSMRFRGENLSHVPFNYANSAIVRPYLTLTPKCRSDWEEKSTWFTHVSLNNMRVETNTARLRTWTLHHAQPAQSITCHDKFEFT